MGAGAPPGYEYVPVTLASGTARLDAKAVASRLYTLEAAQPEGARMQLTLTLPTILGGDPSGTVAALFNATVRGGTALAGAEQPPRWPGATQWATAGDHTVTIRWLKGQPQILTIIGILALLAVAGFLVLEIITHWAFLHWVLTPISPGVPGSPSGLDVLLLAGAVIVGIALLDRLAHG
jgi:hypothetical protein